MALTKNRDTREIAGALVRLTVKTGATIYAGALVAVDSTGYAVPASDAAGLKVVGRAEHQAEAGQPVMVKRGVFLYNNKTGDKVTAAHIGGCCYAADDETVQGTANTNEVVAGIVRGVTADGVYVDTEWNAAAAAATAGAAAGAEAIADDLADDSSTIKAAALVQGAAAIAADLANAESTIKAAATTIAGNAVAAAGNVRLVTAPAAANSTGVKGDIAVDGTYLYFCTAANTWVRAALATATWGAYPMNRGRGE